MKLIKRKNTASIPFMRNISKTDKILNISMHNVRFAIHGPLEDKPKKAKSHR